MKLWLIAGGIADSFACFGYFCFLAFRSPDFGKECERIYIKGSISSAVRDGSFYSCFSDFRTLVIHCLLLRIIYKIGEAVAKPICFSGKS